MVLRKFEKIMWWAIFFLIRCDPRLEKAWETLILALQIEFRGQKNLKALSKVKLKALSKVQIKALNKVKLKALSKKKLKALSKVKL